MLLMVLIQGENLNLEPRVINTLYRTSPPSDITPDEVHYRGTSATLSIPDVFWINHFFLSPSVCSTDSENTAVTLSALLASLNSCCNPWIYMIFSGHLLQDFMHCFSCCRKLNADYKKEDSDSSIRRTTLLTRITNRSPTGSSSNWRELDNSPKTSAQTE